MIDFRYHLVSLISVFLALAVGIALGAGPLKETIGDTLTGQVEQLRQEKDDLRAQLDDTSGDLADTQAFVDAAGTDLLDGVLADRRVAVIVLGELDEAVRTAVDDRLAQAGATVTAHATLTGAWSSPDLRSFRQALAGNLLGYLDPVPPQDAGLEAELAAALVQGLTGADPAAPDSLTANASDLLDVLTSGDDELVTLDAQVQTPADAVVVLAVPVAEGGDAPEPTPQESVSELTTAQLAVVDAAQEYSEGMVVADGPGVAGSLTAAVLADDRLAGRITTVTGTDLVTGQVSVPLALAARIAGTVGHYGFDGGDDAALPPRVELPPVDRTPQTDDAGTEGSADAGSAGGTDGAADTDDTAGAAGRTGSTAGTVR